MEKKSYSLEDLRKKSSHEIQQRGASILEKAAVGHPGSEKTKPNMKNKTSESSIFASPEMAELYSQRKDAIEKHLEQLLGTNEAYFKQIQSGISRRLGQRPMDLNLDYKKGAGSLYQTDFKAPEDTTPVPRIKQSLAHQLSTQQPMQLTTVNRTDFIPLPFDTVESQKKPQIRTFSPFAAASCYNQLYVDWGDKSASVVKPAPHPTVIADLPFTSRSLYNDDYKGKPAESDEERLKIIAKNKTGQYKSPLNPAGIPFISQTTNRSSYYPGNTPISSRSFKPNLKFEAPLPPYSGQFTSVNQKDYTDKIKGHQCNDLNCIICVYKKAA